MKTNLNQVLDMIEGHRTGLLSLLDEECMLPQGSDEAYASKAVRVRNAQYNPYPFGCIRRCCFSHECGNERGITYSNLLPWRPLMPE